MKIFLSFISFFLFVSFSSAALDDDKEMVDKEELGVHSVPKIGVGFIDPPSVVPTMSGANTESKILNIFLFVIKLILYLAGILAVLMIILSGIRWTVSMGNSEMMDGAKRNFLYSIYGLLIIAFSFVIVENIVNILFK